MLIIFSKSAFDIDQHAEIDRFLHTLLLRDYVAENLIYFHAIPEHILFKNLLFDIIIIIPLQHTFDCYRYGLN